MNGLFQPTPSARRVTNAQGCNFYRRRISTHTLRKEGDDGQRSRRRAPGRISTHTLRKEGDDQRRGRQLRLPVISTHTLRKEGDYDREPCYGSTD